MYSQENQPPAQSSTHLAICCLMSLPLSQNKQWLCLVSSIGQHVQNKEKDGFFSPSEVPGEKNPRTCCGRSWYPITFGCAQCGLRVLSGANSYSPQGSRGASWNDLFYVTMCVFHNVQDVNQQYNLGNIRGEMKITGRENQDLPAPKPVRSIYFYI